LLVHAEEIGMSAIMIELSAVLSKWSPNEADFFSIGAVP